MNEDTKVITPMTPNVVGSMEPTKATQNFLDGTSPTYDQSLESNNTGFGTEINQIREEALNQHLAGVDYSTLNTPKEKPDTQKDSITESFSQRDQVMSRLGLMDENLQYTDTYTNYIQQGGKPLPGFESMHQDLLFQDRIESRMQEVEDGQLSYNDALLDLYGKDLLEVMGYNLRSVGWWQSKYKSNDFSNPLKNRYIMDSLIQQADEWHQSRLTKEYAERGVNDTSLKNLVGTELSEQKVRQLFEGIDQVAENMEPKQLMTLINNGQMEASLRLTQDSEGNKFYLHTDGKLYQLSNEKKGDGYAEYTQDSDGNIKEIKTSGGTLVRSFVSGFTGVFTGLASLATSLGGVVWESTLGMFDGSWDVDDAFQLTNSMTGWLNKNAGWLVESGRVDLDGFKTDDASDWGHMLSNLFGSLVGGMTLGTIGGKMANTGSNMIAKAGSSKFTTFAGKSLQYAGNITKYQTGNWGTAVTGMTRPQLWLNHMKTTGTYAMKSLLQDINAMSQQRMMLEDPSQVSDVDIFSRAIQTNAVNFAIDTLISGGVDDNIFQRFTGRQTLSKEAATVYKKFKEESITQGIWNSVKSTAPEVSAYLKSANWVIRLNTAADMVSNYATAIVSRNAQIDTETGKLKDFQLDFSNSADIAARSALTGYWYTHRSQKKSYNVALENIQSLHKNILVELDTKIASASMEDSKKLQKVKAEYIKEYNSQSPDLTAEAKIINSLENLYKTSPEFVQTVADKSLTPKKLEMYQSMYDEAELMFSARKKESLDYLMSHQKTGIKKLPQTLFNWLKGNNEKYTANFAMRRDNFQMETDQEMQSRANYIINQLVGTSLMDSMNRIDKNNPDDPNTERVSELKMMDDFKDDEALIKKINETFPENSANTILHIVRNDKQNEDNFKETLAAYKYAESIGLVKELDANRNIYGVTTTDFLGASIDASMMNSFIKGFNTLIGYSPIETKAEMIKDMITVSNNGGEADAATITNTAINILAHSQRDMSLQESAKLYQELINRKIITPQTINTKRYHSMVNKFSNAYQVIEALTISNADKDKLKTQTFWGQDGMMEAVQELVKEKSLPSDIQKTLETELTKIAKSGDINFHSSGGNQFQKYFYNAAVDFGLPLASDKEINRLLLQADTDEGKRGIEEYKQLYLDQTFSENATEKIKNNLIESYNRMYQFATTTEFNGDDVIIDLTTFTGSETNKFYRQIMARSNSANVKNLSDPSSYDYDGFKIQQETRFKNDLIKNNPGVLRLDITTAQGIEDFNNIMKNFNHALKLTVNDPTGNRDKLASSQISGMLFRDGKWDVMDIKGYDAKDMYTKVKQILETNTLPKEWGGGQAFKIEHFSFDGKSMGTIDDVQYIMNAYDLKNLDPALKASMVDASLLKILPFAQQSEYNTDTLAYSIALYGDLIKLKSGKIAGDAATRYNEMMEATVVDMVRKDPALSTFYANQIVAEGLIAQEDISLPIAAPYSSLRKYHDAGLISLNGEDNGAFWKVQETIKFNAENLHDSKQVTLMFDSSKAEELRQYLYTKDFNMLKMLPFMNGVDFTGETIKVIHQFVDKDNSISSTDMVAGSRKTIYDILNFTFPWDGQENLFKTEYFKKLQEIKPGDTFFSNYEKGTNKFNKYIEPQTFESMDKMLEWSRKNSKSNPTAALLYNYIDAFNKTAYSETSEASENWRLILKNRKVVEKLSDAAEITPALIKEIQDEYKFATPIAREYMGPNAKSQYVGPGDYPVGTIPVSPKIIMNAMGGIDNFHFVDVDGKQWVPSDDVIIEAYNKAQEVKIAASNRFESTYSDYFVPEYVESDVTKLLSILGGSQGNIRIEDADELLRLMETNETFMRQVFDEKVYSELQDKLTKQVAKNKSLYEEAENFITHERVLGLPKEPTMIYDGDISMGRFSGANMKKQEELLMNKINKGLTGQADTYAKLNDDILNAGKYEQYTRKARQDRTEDMLFNIDNPRDAYVTNIAEETGLVLNMNNAVKTAMDLENNLRGLGFTVNSETRNNLMETAKHLISYSQGLQYVNERVKFVVLDNDGKMSGLDATTRRGRGMTETLDDVYKMVINNQDKLKGKMLLSLDKQDINDNSGVPFKTIPLTNDSDVEKISSILTRNFYQEHEWDIRNVVKDGTRSLDEIIGNLDNEKFAEVMNKSALWSISNRESTELTWNKLHDNGLYMDKESFYRALKLGLTTPGGYVDNFKTLEVSNYAAEKTGGNIVDAYNSGNQRMRAQADTLIFGFVPEYLSDSQKEDINKIRTSLLETVPNLSKDIKDNILEYSNEFGSGSRKEKALRKSLSEYLKGQTTQLGDALIDAGLTDGQSVSKDMVADMITGLIASSNKAENMNYFINNTSLKDMKRIRESDNKDVQIQVRADGSTHDLKTLRDTIDSINGENVNTKYKYVVTYDNESSNKMDEMQNRSDFLFSTAFNIKYKDSDGWKTKTIRAYIDHGRDTTQWINEMIDKNSAFYKDNKGYRDDVEAYAKFKTGVPVITDDIVFASADKIREMIEPYMGKESMFIGHNSDNSDLPWLRNAGIFGDNLKDTTLIDTLYLANSSSIKNKGQATVKLSGMMDKIFGIDASLNNAAHGALADAESTFNILKPLLDSQTDISKVSTIGMENLDRMMKSLDIELDDSIISKVDSNIANMKSNLPELYGDGTYPARLGTFVQSVDNVNAIKQSMENYLGRELSKAIWEINSQRSIDGGLAESTYKVLNERVDDRMKNVLTYIQSKTNIPLQDIVSDIKGIVKVNEQDSFKVDRVIELLGTETGNIEVLNAIKNKYGVDVSWEDMNSLLDDVDFKKAKASLSNGLLEDYRVSKLVPDTARSMIDTYEDLRGTNGLIFATRPVMKDLGIEDPRLINYFANELTKVYDFSDSIDVENDYLKKGNIQKIQTPYTKELDNYFASNFKPADALVHTKTGGIYETLGSFNVGTNTKNLLTGTTEPLDSSAIILTKRSFEELVKTPYEQYMKDNKLKDLYTILMVHPADKTAQMQPKRVVVVDSFNGEGNDYGVKLPETLSQTLLARDMDGDKVVVCEPNLKAQDYMRTVSDIAYRVHDVQEVLFDELKRMNIIPKEAQEIYKESGKVYGSTEVQAIVNNLDYLLSKFNGDGSKAMKSSEYKDLKDRFYTEMSRMGLNGDDYFKLVDYKHENHSDKVKGLDVWYVNSPYISDENSISFKNRRMVAEAVIPLVRQYSLIDSMTGVQQKALLDSVQAETITAPLKQLTMNSIFASDIVRDYIEGAEDTNKVMEAFKKAYATVLDKEPASSKKSLITHGWEAFEKTVTEEMSKEDTSKVFDTMSREFHGLLTATEEYLRRKNSNNSKVLTQLKRYIDSGDNTFAAELAVKEKGIDLYNQSQEYNKSWASLGGFKDNNAATYLLNKQLEQMNADGDSISLRNDIVRDNSGKDKSTVFVMLNPPTALDAIISNTKSVNPLTAQRAEEIEYDTRKQLAQIEVDGKKRYIKAGDIIEPGQEILKGVPVTKRAKVVWADTKNRKIHIISEDSLSQTTKVITDSGAKGALHFAETDSDIDLMIAATGTKASRFLKPGENKTVNDAEIVTKTITYMGKQYKVDGYYTKDVTSNIVEDTQDWTKSKIVANDGTGGYNVDYLHFISDGKSLAGPVLLGTAGYYIDDNGDIQYDPTRLKKLKDRVRFPERETSTHNAAGTLQQMRMGALISRMSDDQIQEAFGTDRYTATNNMCRSKFAVTAQYEGYIQYILKNYFPGNKLEELKSSNKTMGKLFSEDIYKLFQNFYPTSAGNIDPDNADSKRRRADALTKQSGVNTNKYMQTELINPTASDVDDRTLMHLEEFYIPTSQVHKYLFDNFRMSKKQYIDLTQRGLLGYGRVLDNTSLNKRFNRQSTDYAIKRSDLAMNSNVLNSDTKSGMSQSPYMDKPLSMMEVKPKLVSNPAFLMDVKGSSNPVLSNAITKDLMSNGNEWTGYNNDAVVWQTILGMGKIKPGMDAYDKASSILGDANGKLYNMSLNRPVIKFTEDGVPYYTLSDTDSKNATAKEQIKNINSTLKDFSYMYSTLKNKEDIIGDNVDVEALRTSTSKEDMARYKSIDESNKQIEDSYNKIMGTLVNSETGEVADKNILDFHNDAHVKSNVSKMKLSYEGDSEAVIKEDPIGISRSGIKLDSPDALAVDVAVKNYTAGATYAEQDASIALAQLQHTVKQLNMSGKDFEDFALYNQLRASLEVSKITKNKEDFNVRMEWINNNRESFENLESRVQKEIIPRYGEVARMYDQYINAIQDLSTRAQQVTGEPFGTMITMFAPFKPKDKAKTQAMVVNSIKNVLNFDMYDHTNTIKSNMMFDFFGSGERMVKELSRIASLEHLSNTFEDKGLISNAKIVDGVNEIISNKLKVEDYKKDYWVKDEGQYREQQEQIVDIIGHYTKLNTVSFKKRHGTIDGLYKALYEQLNDDTSVLISQYNSEMGTNYRSYSDFTRAIENSKTSIEKQRAETVSNYMFARLQVVQGMLETSRSMTENLSTWIGSVQQEGYSFVNKFGQKYERNGTVKPLTGTSLSYLLENAGIEYNSRNEGQWNQFMMEKMLNGEVFLMKNDLVNYLDKNIYTHKIPGRVMKTLKDISKWSSALQMAMPTKLINRLFSFTGFDYAMGVMYSPKTIGKIGQARREILAAFTSKGKQMSPELIEYFAKEGQPIGVRGKDPVTFQEDMSTAAMDRLSKITDPLQIQNHLGRYAIYLAAKESFDKGDGWYGPVYHHKDSIDGLDNNSDKAMMVMDYMLGSPGGFPALSKKTSGLMLYATFPMNLTRTLGAYGMSLGKLASEGFTSENSRHWMRSAITPSLGLVGITALGALLTSLICDIYGVDEETEEKWLKQKVTIDPVGTLLGGTPTLSSSDINPVANIEEMFVTPFTDSRNDNVFKKVFGFLNSNVLSHLNPAIKVPVEVATGKELFGAVPFDTKYYYTNMENATRKTLGFFVGSGISNSVVNQFKIDEYRPDSTFVDSLGKGITRGIQNDLGNQKSYKKDTTNYYNMINSVRNYKAATDNYEDAEVADLMDARYLGSKRNSSAYYGVWNQEDYSRINNLMKTMMNSRVPASQVYSLIVDEFNKGVSEATLRSVLNNNSIVRKIRQTDYKEYLSTLSSKQRQRLQQAIQYEKDTYPLLEDFFPNASDKKNKSLSKPYYKRIYGGGSGSSSKPYTPYVRYPQRYYPNTYSYRRKTSYNPKANLDRVSVNVSPQMAIWKNDYNLTPYEPNLNPFLKTYAERKKVKDSVPEWRR